MAQWIDQPGGSRFSAGLLQISVQLNFVMMRYEAEIKGFHPIILFEEKMGLEQVKQCLILHVRSLLDAAIEGIKEVSSGRA